MIKSNISDSEYDEYEDKFVQFANSDDETKYSMMRDDATLFAYGVFRNRKQERLKLYAYQDLILNDTCKLIALAISRQSGKSVAAVIKAFHHIYYNDNSTVLVISKTLKQSIELIDKLRLLINNSPIKEDIMQSAGSVNNRSEFSLKNHGKDSYSRIISVPATDAARGYSADLVIADEIAFWDNSVDMFNEAILPTISETQGTIIMLSTPKGQLGVFYEAFYGDDSVWSCYKFDWRICPHHTETNMMLYKKQIGEFAFRQEYEASFVANQAAYFKEKEIRDATDNQIELGQYTEQYTVIGVDFGKINDNSVITVGIIENHNDELDYHKVKIIDIIEKPLGTDYNQIVGELKVLFTKYKAINVIYDATGVGEGPGDFMKDLGLPVEPVKFSIQSKVNIYSNLKILFEKRQIKIPNHRRLIDELLLFEYEYTTSGNLKLHHPESGHDDYCDSLALCCYGLKRPGNVTPGVTIL